jgi:trk system potassium uptake protein TrkH
MLNSRVLNTVGLLLVFLGLTMIPSCLWSVYYKEYNDIYSIVLSSILTILSGSILYSLKYLLNFKDNKPNKDLSSSDAFTIVTLGWLFSALFGALPFYLSNNELSFIDSFFESMSGLTTTGATILGSNSIPIESLSHGLLFWRSFTHFLGGMGIIVFSIALLPLLGIGGVQLFRAEVAGPTADKITPRIKQTAKLLWGIYVGFVLFLTVIYYFEGMSFFDSLCHSFGTMATGGFSTHSESLSFFNSSIIEWTTIIFMFAAATNFTLHYIFIAKGEFKYFKNSEFRVYFSIILFVSFLIFLNLIFNNINSFGFDTMRDSIFTTISLLTTTGYTTENYELWPNFATSMCFFLLFLGGTAGSTTGGIKIIRTILIFKYLFVELKRILHPNGIYTIKIGDKIIDDNIIKNTLGFYMFYMFIFIGFAFCISMYDIDLLTSLSTSASAIGNVGPGLGDIGPSDNWGHFPPFIKLFSTFCMLLGRLEIYTVIALISKIFWK